MDIGELGKMKYSKEYVDERISYVRWKNTLERKISGVRTFLEDLLGEVFIGG